MKVLLSIILVTFSLGCQSLSRKPQSADFGGYCPKCLMKNIDKDLSKLQNVLQVKNSKDSLELKVIELESKLKKLESRIDEYESKEENLDGLAEDEATRKRRIEEYNKLKRAIYWTNATTKCNAGYVEGRWFSKRRGGLHKYSYKQCLLRSKLSEQYETYFRIPCAKGYIEGKQFNVIGSYDYKQCVKSTYLQE